MKGHAYVRKGVLWWLLEEGQLNCSQLAHRLDRPQGIVHTTIMNLVKLQQVIKAKEKIACTLCCAPRVTYGLTREGIEQAMQLEPSDAGPYGAPVATT